MGVFSSEKLNLKNNQNKENTHTQKRVRIVKPYEKRVKQMRVNSEGETNSKKSKNEKKQSNKYSNVIRNLRMTVPCNCKEL